MLQGIGGDAADNIRDQVVTLEQKISQLTEELVDKVSSQFSLCVHGGSTTLSSIFFADRAGGEVGGRAGKRETVLLSSPGTGESIRVALELEQGLIKTCFCLSRVPGKS